MAKLTFHPLGNADCLRVDLEDGQKLLFDYANMRDPDDSHDLRIDLPKALREDLKVAGRNHFDVVAFTHLDDDHIRGASEFFYLKHAQKYQSADRVRINTLWVPAAVILEEGCTDEARILQTEARHRFRTGEGIRVFSRPKKLEAWLHEQGLTLAERAHLITDAGQLIPGYTKQRNGVEFFVHSPFANRVDNGELVDRNTDALVVQAAFDHQGIETKVLLCSDVDHAVITEMVRVTRYKDNDERLEWDVIKVAHHSSYLSIGPDKGRDKTAPVPAVDWLFKEQGRPAGIVVSTSKPIPINDDDKQPPHRQAANYYRECADGHKGQFVVTMAHPTITAPKPLVIKIDQWKATVEKHTPVGAAAASTATAPRAG
jgi:hypothetical protein